MAPELHQRVRGIFDKVLDRPESERLQFLEEICGADKETFRAVARLLEAHGVSSFFLDQTSPMARRFGRYVISGELGHGAMGIVYEAADPLIGRTVAVKVIRLQALAQPGEAGSMRERLFREARSAGSLSHPGIVTIFDVGQEGDEAFIAMERVKGPTLQELLASSPRLDCGKALDILRQAAAALDYAHQHGVIHRDVKPANIMLHEGVTVKIADFGIAKLESAADLTRTGGILGTPSHMSPEQIAAKPLDGRSDQFSLATVAFQLLTGLEPFRADSVATLLHQILYGERPSARALNPSLPAAMDKILRRGLEKTPELRYGTCTEFVRALDKAVQDAPAPKRGAARNTEALTATLTAAIEPLKPDSAVRSGGSRRRILTLGAAASAVLAAVIFVYFSGILPLRRTTARTEVLRPEAKPETKPETPRVAAEVKPPPAPVQPDLSQPPPDDAAEPPPKDDKLARAREIYDQAIKSRKAQQQAKAIDLFRQSAKLGDTRAMVELAQTLMTGADPGTPDYDEALRWLRSAAAAGDSSGMVDLGGAYLLGNGVDEDFETAVQWFRKAAAAGNPAGMYDLGTMYENGQGVAEDHDKAKQFYSQAAARGNQAARRRLAEIAAP